jgi:hypothetical protein
VFLDRALQVALEARAAAAEANLKETVATLEQERASSSAEVVSVWKGARLELRVQRGALKP